MQRYVFLKTFLNADSLLASPSIKNFMAIVSTQDYVLRYYETNLRFGYFIAETQFCFLSLYTRISINYRK